MLRERTLLHLLLNVGRALSLVDENSQYRNLILEICSSLDVSKLRNGPYVVKWRAGDRIISHTIEHSRFRFHERGDIRPKDRRDDFPADARTQNWREATAVWKELTKADLMPTLGIAPKSINPKPKSLKVGATGVILTYVLVAGVILILSMRTSGVVILACFCLAIFGFAGWVYVIAIFPLALVLLLDLYDQPAAAILLATLILCLEGLSRKFIYLIPVLLVLVVLSSVSSGALLGLLVLLLFESVYSWLQTRKMRTLLFGVTAVLTLVVSGESGRIALTYSLPTVGVVILSVAVSLFALTRSTAWNSVWIASPIAFATLPISGFDGLTILVIEVLWLLSFLFPVASVQETISTSGMQSRTDQPVMRESEPSRLVIRRR